MLILYVTPVILEMITIQIIVVTLLRVMTSTTTTITQIMIE